MGIQLTGNTAQYPALSCGGGFNAVHFVLLGLVLSFLPHCFLYGAIVDWLAVIQGVGDGAVLHQVLSVEAWGQVGGAAVQELGTDLLGDYHVENEVGPALPSISDGLMED